MLYALLPVIQVGFEGIYSLIIKRIIWLFVIQLCECRREWKGSFSSLLILAKSNFPTNRAFLALLTIQVYGPSKSSVICQFTGELFTLFYLWQVKSMTILRNDYTPSYSSVSNSSYLSVPAPSDWRLQLWRLFGTFEPSNGFQLPKTGTVT